MFPGLQFPPFSSASKRAGNFYGRSNGGSWGWTKAAGWFPAACWAGPPPPPNPPPVWGRVRLNKALPNTIKQTVHLQAAIRTDLSQVGVDGTRLNNVQNPDHLRCLHRWYERVDRQKILAGRVPHRAFRKFFFEREGKARIWTSHGNTLGNR